MYMWRAVDSEDEVLEILVQPQRDKVAALRLLRKLLRHQGFVPTVIVPDEQGLRANNRRTRISRRTKDARLQISQICSALRFGRCGRLQHVQCSTAFDEPSDASTVSNRRASILERRDSRGA
jgi:transposase-like protein